jgi:hypothetical protein
MFSPSGSTAAVRPSQVFSKAVLNESTMGDSGLQIEVIQLFVAQFGNPLAIFGGVFDVKAWRFAAHSLRGTAAAIGALEVAELAAAMERDGPPEGVYDHADAVKAICLAVDRYLAEVRPFTGKSRFAP